MGTYAPLRQPGFPLFLVSVFIATLGTQIEMRAVGWQIQRAFEHAAVLLPTGWLLGRDLELGTDLLLGLVGLAEAIPSLGMALVSGWIADRLDRKRLMLAALAVLLACAGALAALTPWAFAPGRIGVVYAVIAVGGLAISILIPSRTALGVDLLTPELIARAVTLRSFAWMAGAAIGPLLAGPIMRAGGTRAAFLAATACLGVAAALAALIPYRRPPRRPPESLLAGVRGGIAFVRGDRMMLGAMALDLFAVLFGGATAMLPKFAVEVLRTDEFGYGWLSAAHEIGALTAALVLAHAPPFRRAGATMLGAVAVFGACIIAFALSPWLWCSVGLLIAAGMADTVSVLVRSTLIQVRTPSHLRGRVSSVNAIFVGTSNEIGAFESGLAARVLGLVPSVVFGGCMSIAIVVATAWRFPPLRRLGRIGSAAAVEPADKGVAPGS